MLKSPDLREPFNIQTDELKHVHGTLLNSLHMRNLPQEETYATVEGCLAVKLGTQLGMQVLLVYLLRKPFSVWIGHNHSHIEEEQFPRSKNDSVLATLWYNFTFKHRTPERTIKMPLLLSFCYVIVCCAEMDVSVLVMYCGNVQHIIALELTLWCSCRQALEEYSI